VLDLGIDFPPFFQGTEEERIKIQQQILDGTLLNTSVEAREIKEESNASMLSGRDLRPDDSGQPRIVLQEMPLLTEMGVTVGDRLSYRISSQGLFGGSSEDVTFEVVGIEKQGVGFNTGSGSHAPADAFPSNINPSNVTVMVDIEEAHIPELRHGLSDVPGTFALNTAVFTRLISSFVSTFTAFPLLVAALGLVVGGVVIANSVALSTMERQHEIAVMKAVGLQRERVLGMLLLENGILGFIGGLIGVGIGLAGLVASASMSDVPLDAIPWGTAFLLMMLCVGVAVIAAITSAWSASGEKPLTVLRYE
jgi:ABC-type lipoprotein release transport system permease subunit